VTIIMAVVKSQVTVVGYTYYCNTV